MIESDIHLYKLIADTSLLILIWLVQLVIYPSFKYFQKKELLIWHKIYTGKITIVVLPLMLSQLTLSLWLLIENYLSIYNILNLILVLATWFSTFLTFVPLHQKIDQPEFSDKKVYILKLVKYNWLRTLLWSVIFILTLILIFFYEINVISISYITDF